MKHAILRDTTAVIRVITLSRLLYPLIYHCVLHSMLSLCVPLSMLCALLPTTHISTHDRVYSLTFMNILCCELQILLGNQLSPSCTPRLVLSLQICSYSLAHLVELTMDQPCTEKPGVSENANAEYTVDERQVSCIHDTLSIDMLTILLSDCRRGGQASLGRI